MFGELDPVRRQNSGARKEKSRFHVSGNGARTSNLARRERATASQVRSWCEVGAIDSLRPVKQTGRLSFGGVMMLN
jgi:hypothetical protein